MHRKEFLAVLAGAPGACCAMAAQAPQKSPCEQQLGFAQVWVKRLVDTLDKDFDESARTSLLESMGRSCYASSHKEQAANDVEAVIARLRKWTGEDGVRRDGNRIDINLKNPKCLCPLVQNGPDGLSGTFCSCSAGYMKAMFGPYSAGEPQVDMVETIKRGGKTCRVRVTLKKA